MKDKQVCKNCACYICDNNDKCLRCDVCIDNNEYIDDKDCENYLDEE